MSATTVLAKVGFGGSNKFGVFEVTAGNATLPAEILIQELEGVAITGHPNKGAVVLDLTARVNNSAMATYLDSRITTATTDTVSVVFEDGSQIQQSQASGTVTSDVIIYPLVKPQSEGTTRVFVGLGIVSGDSGSVTTSQGAFNETPLQFTTIAVESTITIPNTAFTAVGVTNATMTLTPGSYGEWLSCTPV
jgi:hypothetical protein